VAASGRKQADRAAVLALVIVGGIDSGSRQIIAEILRGPGRVARVQSHVLLDTRAGHGKQVPLAYVLVLEVQRVVLEFVVGSAEWMRSGIIGARQQLEGGAVQAHGQ
jgi:hypothetical protein